MASVFVRNPDNIIPRCSVGPSGCASGITVSGFPLHDSLMYTAWGCCTGSITKPLTTPVYYTDDNALNSKKEIPPAQKVGWAITFDNERHAISAYTISPNWYSYMQCCKAWKLTASYTENGTTVSHVLDEQKAITDWTKVDGMVRTRTFKVRSPYTYSSFYFDFLEHNDDGVGRMMIIGEIELLKYVPDPRSKLACVI